LQIVTGDCAPAEHYVTGPMFVRFDLSAVKRVRVASGVNFEFRVDVLNAFNNVDFVPTTGVQTTLAGLGNAGAPTANGAVAATNTGNFANFASATFGQVTSAYRDANNTADPGGRLVQLGLRVSW
jgi:hypothetical protein